ncbi:MAG: FliG C-terminal domain-containing protein [Pikeienuella sp.]
MNDAQIAPAPAPSTALTRPAETSPARVAARGADRLGPAEKAAIVLIALGPQTASRLLAGLGERRLRRFARAVSDMRETPADVVERVLAEFLQKIEDTRSVGGGADEARRFLSEALDKEQVNQIMGDLDTIGRSVWSLLGDIPDNRIADWLRGEHPQVAAITLSRLTSVKAAKILERFDDAAADDIVVRMGPAASADPAVAARIGEVIKRDFLPQVMSRGARQEPSELIAAVMNHVSAPIRDRLLEAMSGAAPQLASAVRKVMFTYDHIPEKINPRDIGAIIKAVDEAVLLRALKPGGEKSRRSAEFILENISKRLSERLREELEALPEPTRREGEEAQAEVVAAITALRDAGALKMIVAEPAEE